MDALILSRLRQGRIWRRILHERLTEPLHVNLLSAFVALFGSYRARIAHDLVVRPHNAFSILRAADYATDLGLKSVSLLEFGVAAGAGLMNMARIAEQVTRLTGVQFRLYGFDTGRGMPPPVDYRDHPDMYAAGDFVMDFDSLRKALPSNAELVIGDVATTVPKFLASVCAECPIGYVVFDLDYYSSTKAALSVLADADPSKYLPIALAYLDDVTGDRHNSWCGELLAVEEFNRTHERRKIERPMGLAESRLYRRPRWITQIYNIHVLDHPDRLRPTWTAPIALENPYLSAPEKGPT